MSLEITKDVVLLGVIPVKVVKNLTQALGNVAVGHAVGKGVQVNQIKPSPIPEKIQLKCSLLGSDRFVKKFALEALHHQRVWFPFISGLTWIPKVIIENLVFSQNSSRRNMDGSPAIDFIITLAEFKVSGFQRLGTKIAWLAWTNSTYPDPATGRKFYPLPPEPLQESFVVTTEYVETTAIEDVFESSFEEAPALTDEEWTATNTLAKRFDKLPFDVDGVFPQVIKIQYPPTLTHGETFNDVLDIPQLIIDQTRGGFITDNGHLLYSYPIYSAIDIKQLEISILPRDSPNGRYYGLRIKDETGNIIFDLKISTGIIYTIRGKYQIMFNKLTIEQENINPINQRGGEYGSEVEGGIRLT